MSNRIFVVGARGIPDVEGGAEKNAERLFPALVTRGWDITLAGINSNLSGEEYRGVKLVGAPSSHLFRTDKIAYYLTAVFMALRHKPAIVHMQGLGSAIMLWAYRLMGARVVVRYGSADYLLPKWGWLGKAGFLFSEYQLRFAHAVIAVTPALAERLERRGIKDNVYVIPNALDGLTDFDGAEPPSISTPYFLVVGRVTEQKNVHRLMQAFNIFSRDHPGVSLVIAGGLDNKAYYDSLRPHLSDNIHLLGRLPRSTLGGLYAHALAYVNASIHEGHSNAILEALSWQTPIILSDIPENRDFQLRHQHYFDPTDIDEMVLAFKRAVHDRASLIVDRSRFLSWNDVAERTDGLYRSLGAQPQLI